MDMDTNITSTESNRPWVGDMDADMVLKVLHQVTAAKAQFDALPEWMKEGIRDREDILWRVQRIKFENSPIGRALAASRARREEDK